MLPWILAFSLSAAPMEESDPGTAAPSAVSPDYSADVQLITQLISKQYQSWIARDIDGYMAAFWKSPLLVYVIDSDVACNRFAAKSDGHLGCHLSRLRRCLLETDRGNHVEKELTGRGPEVCVENGTGGSVSTDSRTIIGERVH